MGIGGQQEAGREVFFLQCLGGQTLVPAPIGWANGKEGACVFLFQSVLWSSAPSWQPRQQISSMRFCLFCLLWVCFALLFLIF